MWPKITVQVNVFGNVRAARRSVDFPGALAHEFQIEADHSYAPASHAPALVTTCDEIIRDVRVGFGAYSCISPAGHRFLD